MDGESVWALLSAVWKCTGSLLCFGVFILVSITEISKFSILAVGQSGLWGGWCNAVEGRWMEEGRRTVRG